MSRDDDTLFVLVASLALLAAVIALSIVTMDSPGQDPIPLPTAPVEAP